MQSKASTVEGYLSELPEDRRAALQKVRETIRRNLDAGYEEGMQYGMIGYYVPHRVFPAGYHCDPRQPLPFAALASQKGSMSLYLMSLYGSPEHLAWFTEAWTKAGKKLDMGKACIRFKKIEDVPLEVVGEAIRRVPAAKYVAFYLKSRADAGKGAAASRGERKAAAKKVAKKAARKTSKKPAAKKKAAKKTARKRGRD